VRDDPSRWAGHASRARRGFGCRSATAPCEHHERNECPSPHRRPPHNARQNPALPSVRPTTMLRPRRAILGGLSLAIARVVALSRAAR
jgi:hypothetical protein